MDQSFMHSKIAMNIINLYNQGSQVTGEGPLYVYVIVITCPAKVKSFNVSRG